MYAVHMGEKIVKKPKRKEKMENVKNLKEKPYHLLSEEEKEQQKKETARKTALKHGPEGSEIYRRKYEESLGNMDIW